jgi:hypothetical protein
MIESSEMTAFYTICKRLFLPPTKARIDKATMAFNAWRNRGRVEADIISLRNRVQACHIIFTVRRNQRKQKTIPSLSQSKKDIHGHAQLEQNFDQDHGFHHSSGTIIFP